MKGGAPLFANGPNLAEGCSSCSVRCAAHLGRPRKHEPGKCSKWELQAEHLMPGCACRAARRPPVLVPHLLRLQEPELRRKAPAEVAQAKASEGLGSRGGESAV